MRHIFASLVVAVLGLALGASTALAQETSGLDERARLHFQSGTAYFDAGDYEAALREFESAYELSHRPGLLYNLCLAHERLGHLDEAANYLERYLAEQPDIEDRDTLQLRLENLRRRAAGTGETTPPPDDGAATPPDAAPPPDDEGGGGIGIPAIIAFGVGGAGAILWATFGILAISEDSRLAEECPCTPDEVSSLRTYDLLADIGFALTLTGAAVGVLFALLGVGAGSDDDDSASASVAPWVSPEGGGVAVRGRL